MSSPFFTVIIPTRDRPRTLPFAVASVLQQDFPDFELIVADNASSPPASQALAGLQDPRLRILVAPGRLAMHDNWEFGLSHARGRFVMFLGDDDAVMPDGLRLARRLLQHHPAELLTWNRHDFKWPDSTLYPGQLTVRHGSRAGAYDPTNRLREVYGWLGSDGYMTAIYHGLIGADLIARIRAAQGGRYFVDPVCDIESEILNAYFARSALACERPITMNGHSSASNGGANGEAAAVRKAHARFAAEAGLGEADLLPPGWDFPLYMPTMLAGCQTRVKARHFPQDDRYRIDYPRLLQHLAATFFIFGAAEIPGLTARLYRLADQLGVDKAGIRLPDRADYRMTVRPGLRQTADGGTLVCLDANMAGIENISQAVRLTQAMLAPLPPIPGETIADAPQMTPVRAAS